MIPPSQTLSADTPWSPYISRLRRAIDPDVVLHAARRGWSLAARSGRRLEGCEIERVWPRHEKGYVVEYAMRLSSPAGCEVVRIFGELPIGDAADSRRKWLRRLARLTGLRDPAHEAELALLNRLDLVLRPPGIDEKLIGLSLLGQPERIAREIKVAGGPALGAFTCVKLLAHRLGKRAVFRLRLGEPGKTSASSVILKLYQLRSPACDFVSGLMKRLLLDGFGPAYPIRVPELVAVLPSFAALVMEDAPGVPVADLEGDAAISASALAGKTLASLHAQPFRPPNIFGPVDELALLSQWVDLIEALDPRQGRDFRKALSRVQRRLEQCGAFEPTLIHRDFHEKQVLVADHRAVLIDFDTAASGDPAQDIGNFLAHLRLRELQGPADRGEQAAAFLDGYARERGLPELANREAHLRSTLLRLACIYALTTRWAHLTEPLLESA